MKKMLSFWRIIIGGISIFVFGLAVGGFVDQTTSDPRNLPLREQNSKYKFTNPLLLCDTSTATQFEEYQGLRDKISALIKDNEKQSGLKRISVYYRDLNTGRWLGINDNDHYSPASLLKVTTMIAFFKLAETDSNVLKKDIFYDGSFDSNNKESIKPLREIKAGVFYTVEDLMMRMIAYSDNNAMILLNDSVSASLLSEVYTDLGFSAPSLQTPMDFMSARSYSYFFRILYNASYLNHEMSEKALELLSKLNFPKGIRGGVPSNIIVAQKFGERTVLSKNNPTPVTRELHDCGIIYYPKHPYLLCVMTEGSDFGKLADVIQAVSRVVYDETKKQY